MIHKGHRLLFFPQTNSPISNQGISTLFEKEKKMGRNRRLRWADITSCSQVGVDMLLAPPTVPAFISYSSPPSSCQRFISQSLSVTHAPHFPCAPPPPTKTRELQNCPWALLVPSPLKRLVTQASSGPRVWKLLIEDRSQPE